MNIKKVCMFKSDGKYNILPAVLVCKEKDGFRVAFKWWNFHFGVYWVWKEINIKFKV